MCIRDSCWRPELFFEKCLAPDGVLLSLGTIDHQKNSLGVLLGCKSVRNASAVFVLVGQVLRVENGD